MEYFLGGLTEEEMQKLVRLGTMHINAEIGHELPGEEQIELGPCMIIQAYPDQCKDGMPPACLTVYPQTRIVHARDISEASPLTQFLSELAGNHRTVDEG